MHFNRKPFYYGLQANSKKYLEEILTSKHQAPQVKIESIYSGINSTGYQQIRSRIPDVIYNKNASMIDVIKCFNYLINA